MDTINDIQYFVKESQFEQALVDLLPHHGWEKEVIPKIRKQSQWQSQLQ